MPSRQRVQQLVRLVEHGKIPEAIEQFYAENVVMQDNAHPPVIGKEANLQREKEWRDSVADLHESRAVSFAVDGDQVVIHWLLDYTKKDGQHLRMDELAYQTWLEDRIVSERFFYDSAALQA